MRERLIELLDECRGIEGIGRELLEKKADHLLANGVIVPPCKVGDKMYCDGEHFADHCKGKIMEFPVDIILTEVCSTHRGEIDMAFDFKKFGKIVFTSREEAEKALKEAEG